MDSLSQLKHAQQKRQQRPQDRVSLPHQMEREIKSSLNQLETLLNPFLHGGRFTSYGRHFTKKEHLNFVSPCVGFVCCLFSNVGN